MIENPNNVLNKKLNIILASYIENGTLEYNDSIKHIANLEASLSVIRDNNITLINPGTPRANWDDTPLSCKVKSNSPIPTLDQATQTIEDFSPVLDELLNKMSKVDNSLTTNWVNILDKNITNHFAKLDLSSFFTERFKREEFIKSFIQDTNRLYTYEYHSLNNKVEEVLNKLDPINLSYIDRKYLENSDKLIEILSRTKTPVELDLEFFEDIILKIKHLFRTLSDIELNLLNSLLKHEWLLLLKLEPYLISKIGVVVFFNVWTWIHVSGNFEKLMKKVLSGIQYNAAGSKLALIKGRTVFAFKGVIPTLALFTFSFIYGQFVTKNQATAIMEETKYGFEGVLGEYFDFVKINAGKFAYSLTNLSSYCFDQALRGWLDPKLIIYGQFKDFFTNKK